MTCEILTIRYCILFQLLVDSPFVFFCWHRCDLTGFINANLSKLSGNTIRVSKDSLLSSGNGEILDFNHRKGIDLLSKGKLAFLFTLDNKQDGEAILPNMTDSQNVSESPGYFNILALLEDLKISKVGTLLYFGFDLLAQSSYGVSTKSSSDKCRWRSITDHYL